MYKNIAVPNMSCNRSQNLLNTIWKSIHSTKSISKELSKTPGDDI